MLIPTIDYRGRFAPSPTGELHFGSLLAAMASYADARSHNGSWLLRIDDVDQARVVKHSDQHILKTLEQCGFQWDESVTYQSHNNDYYHDALEHLNKSKRTYSCNCSRKQLSQYSDSPIYPGFCRDKLIINTHQNNQIASAIRIQVPSEIMSFTDRIQANFSQNLSHDSGDFIIYRRDHVFSYQLSVVLDDYYSKITHIVRGSDLLDSTIKQIYLQQLLNISQPQYAHIPLAVSEDNLKFSKLSQAQKVSCDLKTLLLAAQFLGHNIGTHYDFSNINDFWHCLITNWDIKQVPKKEKLVIMV